MAGSITQVQYLPYNLLTVGCADIWHSVELNVLLQMTLLLALLCYSALSAGVYLLGIVVWSSADLEFWQLAQSDIVIVLCTISISSVLLCAISKLQS